MIYEEAIIKAAHKADRAAQRAMTKYSRRLVTDEDDITGILIGALDTELEGNIDGLTWSTSILRHRRGVAAEEKKIGADMVFHVSLRTKDYSYSKGVLIQAKRNEPGQSMTLPAYAELSDQCQKMLEVTPSSFVFNYAKSGMRCGSATLIANSSDRDLYDVCDWTSYRFFLELFRCFIGDSRLNSAVVDDLPIPTVVKITAEGG